ncbi:hypothetical protein GMORB2_1382 [Geosmithia morbida]|uniref:WSC domain-containing protein n=1 Tax=Geosmithia morbida TaxID=1094350 RepID=A0A9P5D713_9HYPO|nr:uncharacterized protein GMORB2_1382 [Geosmithia morbida]KAF4126136.1 hypothetical protein GMORB2_1382 [Geosmithia morbida]
MKSVSVLLASLAAASQFLGVAAAHSPSRVGLSPNKVARGTASQTPSTAPVVGGVASQGCYSSKANMTSGKVTAAQVSSGSCREYCLEKEYYLIALNGQNCYCGYAMPESEYQVKDSKCSFPCPAYPEEACGGIGSPSYYTIFNIGVTVDPPVYKEEEESTSTSSSSSTSTSTSSSSSSSTQVPSSTAVASATQTAEDKKDDDKSNVAGIAGGVVAGVVLAGAAVGALWFFMRRRRNSELEEEQRRNAAVNAFISGSKPPGSSGSISMTDSRLDPVMAHRRLSDGSIDDNMDYSRKILRVTNA